MATVLTRGFPARRSQCSLITSRTEVSTYPVFPSKLVLDHLVYPG